MATITKALRPENANGGFQLWGKEISDALTTFGLVKTNDTGQINWSTVINPSGVGQFVGYEIRTFTDSLSATHPVVFKIEYGSSAVGVDIPALRFTFGTNSNSLGTVGHTANISNVSNITVSLPASSSTPRDCFLSGSTNRLGFTLFRNLSLNSGAIMYFSLERTKNSVGQDTGEGCLITTYSYSSGFSPPPIRNYYFPFIGAIPPEQGQPNGGTSSGIYTPRNSTGVDGLTINVYPNIFWKRGTPIIGINTLGYFIDDISTGVNTLNVLGSNRSYYFISHPSLNAIGFGYTSNINLAMLFE